MKNNFFSTTRFIIIISALLVIVAIVLMKSEIDGIKALFQKVALDSAKSHFNTIVIMRKWNSLHDGVYVPVTPQTEPNPYLEDPLREVETTDGMILTKVNPAYMTRLIADIANQDLDLKFHITSLKPLNPNNAADQWERQALESFEEGAKSNYGILKSGTKRDFRYMAPLKVENECLQCHAKQGYQVGDIRGGISVTMPYEPFQRAQDQAILISLSRYIILLMFAAAVGTYFGRKTIFTEKEMRKLTQAVEQSANSVVITDTEGRIVYVNPKVEEVTGYSAAEVIGKNPHILKSGEQGVEFYQEMWETIGNGKEWHGTFHNKKKNGDMFWEKASIAPVRDHRGTITNYIAIKEDITKLKEATEERERLINETRQALEQLKEVDHLKSELVNVVSHELRTPLTSILGFSELLLRKSVGEAKTKKYLTTIHNEAVRLTGLINSFLDLQKIEAGRFEFKKQSLDIGEIARNCINVYQAQSNRHTLVLDLEENIPPIWVDPDRLTQVLGNLLSNAIKYSPAGGPIEVKVSSGPTAEVKIAVRDHGLGIPEDAQSTLFQPFYRVDNSDRRQIGGTGLGLAICQKIIHALGGRIWVQSVHGLGSTFTFTLPDVTIQRETNMKEEVSAAAEPFILIVEDDRSTADIFKETLVTAGYITRIVDNGPTALAITEQMLPVAIILDLVLVGPLDGWEVLRRLKQDVRTKNVPVIISSCLEKSQEGLELWVADYLVKPFPPDKLVESVRNAVQTANGVVELPFTTQKIEDEVKGLLESKGFAVQKIINRDDLLVIFIDSAQPGKIGGDLA